MSTDSPRPRCRWYVRRLPLLAGGELAGTERRKVERHLITCPDCRRRQAAMAGALGVLHAAAAEMPAAAVGAASLWPALERQIREERHAPRRAVPARGLIPWTDALASWFRPRALAFLALIVLATGAVAGGVELWAQRRVAALLEAGRQPIAPPLDAALLATSPALDPAPGATVAWEAQPSPLATESSRPAQVDYDLDTGTPMGPDARERGTKASY